MSGVPERAAHGAAGGEAREATGAENRNLGYVGTAVPVQQQRAALLQSAAQGADGAPHAHAALALAWRAPAVARHTHFNFALLPHAVALHVLSFVPADARARAALVCRAWRVLSAERSLWETQDLSRPSGVTVPVTDALLRGAAARAGGRLTVLNLDDCDNVTPAALLEVIMANAASLRELRFFSSTPMPVAEVNALVRAAPQLQLFEAEASASTAEALRMLRNDAPFGALRLRGLCITYAEDDGHETVLAFAAALSGHQTLRKLDLHFFPLDEAALLGAVVASALACGVSELSFLMCRFSPASAPELARLIRECTLKDLSIFGGGQLLDEPAAALFADAIAANRSLTCVCLQAVDFWHNAAAAASVMRALSRHPSLRSLSFFGNDPPDQAAAGAALGALVAANAPSLHSHYVSDSALGDAGMSPLLDALTQSTHLGLLYCTNTGMSEAFARDRFLPAVRANASLLVLNASADWGGAGDAQAPAEVLEAEALVAARAAGRQA